MNIREYLENHKLLTDGAMGTYFDSIEKENYICSEEANITNPALVREIHRSYVKNGAQLLRSNTFLANEGTFLSLTQAKAEAFENITLKQLIIAGYQLAKETAQEVYQEEYPIFAAADVQGQLAGTLLRCAPAHTVGVAADVLDLIGLDPCALFGDGSRTMLRTFGDRAHILYLLRIGHNHTLLLTNVALQHKAAAAPCRHSRCPLLLASDRARRSLSAP